MTNTNITDAEKQKIVDEEHLKLLRIGYLVSGGATCFFALFPLIYVAMGILFIFAPPPNHAVRPGEPPLATMGAIIATIGGIISLALAVEGALKLLVAKSLRQRRRRVFCMVMAAISSFSMPYGTMLGVFSFMLLTRPSIQTLFANGGKEEPVVGNFSQTTASELPAGDPRPYVSIFNQESHEDNKQYVERERQ